MAGDKLQKIDLINVLNKHRQEAIYYKTDHHWTSLGAYYAFGQLAKEMEIGNTAGGYNIYTVADDFQGTLASKSGYHGSEDVVQV
ncbi:DHHW family protein, partial [uncultured Ligilactobacillus sp.]|uniref:DHHW family protein n=1 Tax=uncultured Ligilactobacillus sp. TaxID=2837633 RepID=UPI00272AF5C7